MNHTPLHQAVEDLSDWQVNLRRHADDAAKLTADWTAEDVAEFPQFMAKFLPHAVQAFHGQRPSRRGGGRRG